MAYSDFTLEKVKSSFELKITEGLSLFNDVQPSFPSHALPEMLEETVPLANAIGSEKARSELIIMPVLLEVRRLVGAGQVSLFSGVDFNVDPSRGLVGFCDFILGRSPEQFYIQAPVVTVVEAKNENIKGGLGQCIAEMVAAATFNELQGSDITTILGAVTTGELWRFLLLDKDSVTIDRQTYFIREIETILGILVQGVRN